MAPLYPVRAASLRRTQDTTLQQDTQSSKPRSPSKGSPKKPKSPGKSKSSSSPLPKSVLVTPGKSPQKSPKSRRHVTFEENDHVHEIEDGPASDGEDTAQPEPQTLVPGFVWPLKFPDYSQLVDVCVARGMSTFDGQRVSVDVLGYQTRLVLNLFERFTGHLILGEFLLVEGDRKQGEAFSGIEDGSENAV